MKSIKEKIYILAAICSVFGALEYLLCKFLIVNAAQYSVLFIILFIGVIYILHNRLLVENGCVGKKYDWLLGYLFAATAITGIYFDNDLPYEAMGKDIIGYIVCIFAAAPLFKCIFTELYLMVSRFAGRERENKNPDRKSIYEWRTFAVSFMVILMCWILVWLAYYPGLWNYDPWQVDQVLNNDYNEFHPLIHTLLLGSCYSLGLKIGNANYGVIIYDFVQMIIMAGVFAYTYCYICKHIKNKICRVVILLFYAVFPVNSIMAISTTKDVIFSGLVLFCLVLVLQITEADTSDKKKMVLCILLLITCPVMLLFRNNAVYAFILLGVCCACMAIIRKGNWKVVAFMCVCLLLFGMERNVMRTILKPAEGSANELFSVPSQQFGRIYSSIGESGDQETMDIINYYYDMEQLEYRPNLADYMKCGLRLSDERSVSDYLHASLVLLKKYPAISIDAFLYLTEGYWNIGDVSFASLYGTKWDGNVEHRYGYMLTTIKPGYGIVPDSKLPFLERFMEKLISKNEYQNYPVLALLLSPSLYLWILIMSTLVFLKSKNKEYLFVVGFLWLLFLTLLAGPCVLVRYVYPFIVSSPLLFCLVINNLKNEKILEKVEK